jgi:hypothetical protein
LIPITKEIVPTNIKNQELVKKSLTAIIYLVAVGSVSGSQKKEVRVGITFTIKIAVHPTIPTTMIIG